MTTFIDSHAHLADPAFDADREAVIERAVLTGASAIVCIGESLDAATRAAAIATAHPGRCFFTAGVHPHDAAGFDAARDLAALRQRVGSGAVAIGECGLDYHYDHSPRDKQREAFGAQLELARELNRAVVVHTREAEHDTMSMVRLVPEDRLLVESDSPYLAPVPHRGARNEPAWVTFTLARLAAARGTDAATLGPVTAANTRRLFGLA